jgi:hypothetical protein
MKVKELIQKLQEYDPETMVVVNGYEGGVNACSVCREESIKLGVNSEWYYGNHEIVEEEEESDCKAILIG